MTAEFDLVPEAEFFAPVSTDLLSSLVADYNGKRAGVEALAATMAVPQTQALLHYFLDGNSNEERGRYTMERTASQLFDLPGAIGALNSAFWSKALSFTDVIDTMPQKRRDEWYQQLKNPLGVKKERSSTEWQIHPLPDFTDNTVRDTIGGLLTMRAQFLAERVDGIFRGLSGEHVTNAPEAFGKRMIIAGVLSSWGCSDHSRTGLINDLRAVIAKFMGRDEPKYSASDKLVNTLKGRWGDWVTVDGGALRIRLYMKGTAHLEVHPEMAWRLNQILAHLYPLAIPAQFRQRPPRKVKQVPLMMRPLPFAVLAVLAAVKQASVKVPVGNYDHTYRDVKHAVTMPYTENKAAGKEAERILESIGGAVGEFGFWHFDYPPLPVIDEICASGCIPDQVSHQFYPTPPELAARVVEMADIKPGMSVLEPSAGQGGLADLMPGCVCVEAAALNFKVLTAKGHQALHADFLAWAASAQPADKFDRVVMNPPFDQGRWLAHVEAAAKLVSAGGRLVAILPSGAFKRLDLGHGWKCSWVGPLENQFPGVSVDVVILTADRAS
jgi:Domain of unknown function (DUF4942)